ncbi:conserved hypothetical protein [Bosea sp. 62]|uniref:bifunctional DNA primase/polymerase n=1 Tax=unclassified Bosea (in: a-proteobacteria) TaxID=2653178 RepID=UPI001256BE7F|nr:MULTISPECIES: bifunctional DNA primase/polymerase [unclassified Bosea (in: a-proteobacteria)]CAD5254229.1 conserved hypothetical protein [Bosea sp. 7B]CAD5276839.1 conserved hypothetical protein [Bosea sp. 21B]CAD5277972.1 conserved hypothetical protein [Bosea sp. 46]VVT59835.1 conserved hypothetical protein [Bosea sp. EC-HK365B]VXB45278.1 conserved hypothetical protein [Bosea sp. 62]
MDNPNLTAAKRLADLGIAVFPCNQTKRPQPGVRWKDEASTDPRRIEAWWRRWPSSLPAFELGRHKLVAIDCDRHGKDDGVIALETLARDNGDDPRDWPTVETPSTGRHVFFRQDGALTNARGTLPAGIDVRGSGGYVIAEGAELPDGRNYHPLGDGLVTALQADAIPDLPQWLATTLASRVVDDARSAEIIATSRVPAAAPAHRPETGARERAAFEAALADEVRKVTQAGEGQRNHTLNIAAFSLAQMVASGWGGQSEVDIALTEAALACGLRQPEIRKTIASGFASGSKKPRAALDDRAGYADSGPEIEIRLTKVNGVTIVADTGEVVDDADDDPEDEEGEAPPIDEALTHVDGVLGEVIDFIVATSRRPNRRLALSAALPLCATLLGRRMATPTGAGLQLYVIATYPTGGGKQHQLDAIDRLMRAAELQRHVGPSQFMSMSALVKHVANSPLTICAQDEFGALLKRLSHPRASTHEQGISMVLRSLWGSNFATVRTPAYASTSSVEIAAPCLSLYGPTTPEELYEALRGRDVVNGFLNRFLVIDGGERVAEVEPRRKLRDVPDSLRDGMMRLYRAGTTGRGNLSGYVCKNTAPDPEGLHARWQDQRAEDIYRDLSSTAQRRIDADAETGQFMARVAEIAVRCATIRACGRDPDIPTVTGDDMDWAAALVWQSTERLIGDAGRFMVDPLGAAEFERKLLAKVHSAGPRGVRMRELHRAMQRHFRFANDLRNTLDALSRSGVIVVDERKVAGGVSRRVMMA